MKKYVGVKLVEAEPLNLGDYNKLRGWTIPADEDPLTEGYLVVYPDGYMSWCPKKQFEEANRPVTGMSFGQALECLKKGMKVTRTGWKNPCIWCELQVPTEHSKMTKPYIYLVKYDDMFPLDLSCESILEDDWIIVE